MDPLKAQEIPRPRRAGLFPPRQLLNESQYVSVVGFEIKPAASTEELQGLPDGFRPRVDCNAELTPLEPFSVY
jgi:hypothetical protein